MSGSLCASSCCAFALIPKSTPPIAVVGGNRSFVNNQISRLRIRVSMVDSSSSSSDFTKRMEQVWLISQTQNPILNSNFMLG